MRRYFTILLAVATIAAYTPTIEASQSDAAQRVNQNRSKGNRNSGSSQDNGYKQPGGNNGGGNGGQRPNNSGGGNNGGGNAGNRPNNPGGGNNGGGNGGYRPNNPGGGNGGYGGGHGGGNPGNSWSNPGPGYGPHNHWNGNRHDVPHYAPSRPMMPYGWHYSRPVPPPAFRPAPGAPNFGSILGLTLGSTINYAIFQLFGNGYYVTGYTKDAIYINDVVMLNIIWPHATLIYNRGYLSASEFVYSTYNYDTSRYNNVYNRLINNYGPPSSSEYLPNGGLCTTWWGYNGRYIQLKYEPGYANDGQYRYFTSLNIGN